MKRDADRLAISTADLRLEIKQALQRSRALGFGAVDIDATVGAVSPRELTSSGRRHLTRYLGDLGLRLASLRGPATRSSYIDPAHGEQRLDTMRTIVALAGDLRVPVVTTTIGGTPNSLDEAGTVRLRDALAVLANDADRYGVRVAIETAGVSPHMLRRLLSDLNCPLLGAACDSGAMLMQGDNPHAVADALAGRVQLVRARDAIAGSADAAGRETAFGEGHLDLPAFLASLAEAGFNGDFVLSRTDGPNPAADLQAARGKLANLLAFDRR